MSDHDALADAVAELVALRGRPGDSGQIRGEASWIARGWLPRTKPSPSLAGLVGHLAGLDDVAFSQLLRRAANRGLIMRDEVGPNGVPAYRPVDPARAVGSKLDEEIEEFREGQRKLRPDGDLPGQRLMFDAADAEGQHR